MPDAEKRSSASDGATFGAILVLIGVGLLLERMDVLPEGALWRLWDLWPLILVGWGLSVLAHSVRQPWLAWLGPLLVLGVGSYLLVTAPVDPPAVEPGTLTETIAGDRTVAVEISFGAGALNLGSGGGADIVVDHKGAPRPRIGIDGERVEVSSEDPSWSCLRHRPGAVWTVKLPDRTTRVEVDAGAADVEADLTDLEITEVEIDAGAADVDIKIGRRVPCSVSVSAGASDVTIRIPEDAQLEVDANIAAGDSTIADGTPTAEGPIVKIEIDGGAADFEVVRY